LFLKIKGGKLRNPPARVNTNNLPYFTIQIFCPKNHAKCAHFSHSDKEKKGRVKVGFNFFRDVVESLFYLLRCGDYAEEVVFD
jgi:hypothetical protein